MRLRTRHDVGSKATLIAICVASLALFAATGAQAYKGPTKTLPDGVERTTYRIGPLDITSGQNRISLKPITGTEKPSVDGWITRIKPDLVRADGSIPKSSKVMFHHGVWLSLNSEFGAGPFYATGEEKTIMDFPDGYGLRYKASDVWLLNHMIHNLIPDPMELYVTYTIDFVPDTSPAAASITPIKPIWMDVESGIYPVFDVHRGDGGKDGEFTYPTDAENPYPPGVQKNERTIQEDGVLVGTTGHVHNGGLSTDLYLKREGARYAGPKCKNRRGKARRKCVRSKPLVDGDRVRIFRSAAKYFEPAGPVSWDMAMMSTKPNWRVAVKAGDTLELTTTYETKRASWYESMGINLVYIAPPEGGKDPYKKKVDWPGVLNHGHYPENNDHGGKKPTIGADPTKLPNGIAATDPFRIAGFAYEAGDMRVPGQYGRPPVVPKGQSFTFELDPADDANGIWHSLTSCKAPCNKSTGIAYPIADGKFQFDSGQMGTGGPPTVERTSWTTPSNLPVGTHTYFCRIHPLMRGAFRVVKPGSS